MSGPLDGRRIVVTRSREQASGLAGQLRELGAEAIEIATIQIVEPSDGGSGLRNAVESIDRFGWVVVASPNGARALLDAVGAGAPLPPIACVGPSTAAVLSDAGYAVEVVPDRFVAEGLVDAMPPPSAPGERVLVVQAEVGRPVIADGLTALGYLVDRVAGYRTVDAPITSADQAAAASADIATFTSSSTVERFVRLVGIDNLPPVVACIGPITAVTATELGLTVDIEAEVSTIAGLVDSLVAWASHR